MARKDIPFVNQSEEDRKRIRALAENDRMQLVVDNKYVGLDEEAVQQVKGKVKLEGHL